MSSVTPSATNLSIDELTGTQITPMGRFAIWSSLLSVLFLTQIAYSIGDFPVSTVFLCYAMTALYLLTSGSASFSLLILMLYLIAAVVASLTMVLLKSPLTSWTSLLLLSVLYAPYPFRLKSEPDLASVQQYIERAYVAAATVIAAIAVVQIILVNGFGASSLTNIYFVLPNEISAAGNYTFLRTTGEIVKANGFFLRESTELSLVTALALIIEYFTRARYHILSILAAGLFCSLSGAGFLCLIVGFVMPRWSLNRVPHFLLYSLVFIAAFFILYYSEIPGLNLFFDRLSEFNTAGTSGYARYAAPMNMVQQNFDEGGTTMWLGHGAGTYLRSTRLLGLKFEINDPTWAKLIYEYGLVGFTMISTLFIVRVYSSALKPEVCIFILFDWISSPALLSAGFVVIFWLLTLVPRHLSGHVQPGARRRNQGGVGLKRRSVNDW
jgi:hypothetical protein